ncbi:DUF945 domain-containing protein [bacterium]|nr:DUF945 domain-containing protein [bacterium]
MNELATKDAFCYDQNDLSEILFPVELRPVFVPMPHHQQGELLQPSDLQEITKYKALVDVERDHVFTIVSNDYKVITNQEAIKLGELCFQTVFKLTAPGKMQPFNIIKPETCSFCHIDFVHSDAKSDYFDNDPWTPFLRVTNSYNKTRALKFDLGFCRGICKNGLIFGKQTIEFKFTHTKSAKNDPGARFILKSGEFAKLEQEFIENLRNLKRFHVPRNVMWPLLCKLFDLKIPPADATDRQVDSWHAAEHLAKSKMEHYFDKLGENGYAALNVMTDFSTRPPKVGFGPARINTMQTNCGEWTEDFCLEIRSEDFNFAKYLGDYQRLAV